MDEQEKKNRIRVRIKKRMIDLQSAGKKTSKGEPISEAAIGRACDPPVSRVAVHCVVKGEKESRRIKERIEQELGETYWLRRKAA